MLSICDSPRIQRKNRYRTHDTMISIPTCWSDSLLFSHILPIMSYILRKLTFPHKDIRIVWPLSPKKAEELPSTNVSYLASLQIKCPGPVIHKATAYYLSAIFIVKVKKFTNPHKFLIFLCPTVNSWTSTVVQIQLSAHQQKWHTYCVNNTVNPTKPLPP